MREFESLRPHEKCQRTLAFVSTTHPARSRFVVARTSRVDFCSSLLILSLVAKYAALDRVFHALGDPSRRAMVERLSRGPASVSDLARPFDMALPTVVEHLRVLETAGIVSSTKLGRVRTYQLAVDGFGEAIDWMTEHRLPAERRLDRLGEVLNQPVRELPKEKE